MHRWAEGIRVEALANLAHELRSPLQVLIGYLDILRDEWAEKFAPEPQMMLERMNSNLLYDLTRTVDNIMEFVMSEAGADGRIEEDVSISNLVSDLTPAIEAAKGDKPLILKIDIKDASRPFTHHVARCVRSSPTLCSTRSSSPSAGALPSGSAVRAPAVQNQALCSRSRTPG